MTQDELKKKVATAALEYVEAGTIVGVGTGSTANHFIDALATVKGRYESAVSSSEASTARLKVHGIPVPSPVPRLRHLVSRDTVLKCWISMQ